MKTFCPLCDSEDSIVEEEIDIPVGKKTFPAVTEVCKKCGGYSISPDLQDQIDTWASDLKQNFIEVQPRLSPVVHKYLDDYVKGKGLNKIEYVRIFTAFYLTDLVSDDQFNDVKDFLSRENVDKIIREGSRIPTSVPVRYALHKKIQDYSILTGEKPAKVMEEAVLFCIALKNHEDDRLIRQIAASLNAWVERARMLA